MVSRVEPLALAGATDDDDNDISKIQTHNAFPTIVVGNRRFRMIIDEHLDTYMEVMSRSQKTKIVTTIVRNIRSNAAQSGGGFVRKDLLTRRWFKVSDKLAREKVGQALRDAIKTRRSIGGTKTNKGSRGGKKVIDTNGLRTMLDEQVVHFPIGGTAQDPTTSAIRPVAAPSSNTPITLGASSIRRVGAALQGTTYTQQLVADLEPTPIRAHSSLNLPGIFDRSSMAHQRSETSAYTLLRLFDEGAAKGDAAAVAAAAASQSRRLSLSQMAFHPVGGDQGASLLKNGYKFV